MTGTETETVVAAKRPPAQTETPLVSVIISNFNHGKFIEQAIAGILRQSLQSFEVIITDDGSTDGSQEVIRRLAARDRRIKVDFFRKNKGAMAATANNMARVTGKLLYGGAADDFIIDEHFFKRAVDGLQAYPEAAGFFGVAGIYCSDTNKLTGAMGSAPREGYIDPVTFTRSFLQGGTFVPGNSSIWRLDAFRALGGFDYSLGPQVDFWINHALPLKHGVVFANAPVTCQREYQSHTNFGSKGTLWEVAARFAKVEAALRPLMEPYEGSERDWAHWRARWMMTSIGHTGVNIR